MVLNVKVRDRRAVIVQEAVAESTAFHDTAGQHGQPRHQVVTAAFAKLLAKRPSPGLRLVFIAIFMYVGPSLADVLPGNRDELLDALAKMIIERIPPKEIGAHRVENCISEP